MSLIDAYFCCLLKFLLFFYITCSNYYDILILENHSLDCGSTILRYMFMNYNIGDDVNQTIRTYKMLRPMMDEMQKTGYLSAAEMSNKYMRDSQMTLRIKKIMHFLNDNILSAVCPLTFDLRLNSHQKNTMVCASHNL